MVILQGGDQRFITWLFGCCLVSSFLSGCGSPGPLEVEPALPNLFTESALYREPDVLLTDRIEACVGETYDVRCVLTPKSGFPQELDGHPVHPIEHWAVQFSFYPAGSHADAKDSIRFPIRAWFNTNPPGPGFGGMGGPHYYPPRVNNLMPSGPLSFPGYHPALIDPQNQPPIVFLRQPDVKGTFEYWALMGAAFETPGEYVFEMRLFPAWHEIDTGFSRRTELGTAVVLQRSVLQVSAAADPVTAAAAGPSD